MEERTITLNELIRLAKTRSGLSQETLRKSLQALLGATSEALDEGKRVSLDIFIFLAALMIASCRSSKSEMTHRGKENLEASLDYPKQLKIIAHSQPDSAFGVTYFTRNEITGMLKVMAVVTKQLMAKTKDISDISNSDAYTVGLMRRQMNAATEVQNMIFKNVPKGQWSGWKVKIDYECVDKDGLKYRAERWVFFDKDGKNVIKTFEIPLP